MKGEELRLADLVAFARERGGCCLSTELRGEGVKHRWRCGRDHEFEASPRLLMRGGYWCPQCFPSVEDPSGWNYEAQVAIDPLLRRFYRSAE